MLMATDQSTLFPQATQLAKAGQKTEALVLLRRLLIQEPTHVPTLMYLAWLTPDVHEGITALERVTTLSSEPAVTARAQQGLVVLRAKAAAPSISDQPVLAESIAPSVPIEPQPPVLPPVPDPIAQGRTVIWPFRKLNRPIGELLGEGKITMKDLHWVAGTDPRVSDEVRATAKALLDEPAQPAGTTVEANWDEAVLTARQVIWLYRRTHRPMGELLDDGIVFEKVKTGLLKFMANHPELK